MTVENMGLRPALSTEQQQKEMIAILDKCVELNLNAVIFQGTTSSIGNWSPRRQMATTYQPPFDLVDEPPRRALSAVVVVARAWF